MEQQSADCNLDLVVEMEEMGVGVDEILHYARAIFDRDELRTLARGVEQLVPESVPLETIGSA